MRQWIVLAVFAALCTAKPLHAQTFVGIWQGTTGKQQHVLKITKERGALLGEWYDLGSDASAKPVSAFTLESGKIRFDLDNVLGTFEGIVAADGKSIVGSWQTYGKPQPLTFERATEKAAWVIDPSPHKVQFVAVDKDVRLEVLDWGGEGPPLVFLAGLASTTHVFDTLAPKLIAKHHVYGITRRGYGASSLPSPTDENYNADRLGDDVLAVMDALKLDRPVIAGHSIAGEELSSIGTRHPERVAGLIYLDAAWSYAFYSPSNTVDNFTTDASVLRRDLAELLDASPSRARALIQEIQTTTPHLQKSLQFIQRFLEGAPDEPPLRQTRQHMASQALRNNERPYSDIKAPALVIMAVPHDCKSTDCDSPQMKATNEADRAQADAVEAGMKSAHIVRLPHADHAVWRSNEADVLREMNAFMDGLH